MPDATPSRPLVFAHRGGSGPWHENTLEAFDAAARSGADGVELDVRRAADGSLVVVHDAVLPQVGEVHALMRAELPGWVPGLEEALAACGPLLVNVEIKNNPGDPGHDPDEQVAAGVVAALEGEGGSPARLVSAFSPRTVEAVVAQCAARGLAVPVHLLVHPALPIEPALALAAELGCAGLNPHHRSTDRLVVDAAHALGLAVHCWTVNDPGRVAELADLEVDAIITDQVESTLETLGRSSRGA